MKKLLLQTFTLIIVSISVFAQNSELTGVVKDAQDNTGVSGASILLINARDSTLRKGVLADVNGAFKLSNLKTGNYKLRISSIGYANLETRVSLGNGLKDLGILKLSENASQLGEVTVREKQVRVEQKGDTIQYNASAFKTNPDATVEDLVKKMPGVTIENGVVKAQGEEVKKVTVDGQEFFGDDAALALKNLPAEVVDRIQVFDRLSEQAQFTGFDDGNSVKTINITTRQNKNNGQFGKIYAGAGDDQRYQSGASVNFFKKDQRLTIIGLSNNINQQNFSNQDILGVLGNSGGGGMGGFGGGQGGGGGMRPQSGGGGGTGPRGAGGGQGGGGGGDAGNFMVGQQPGIAKTTSIGLNYSDNLGKKVKLSTSYFFNAANNGNQSITSREYLGSVPQMYHDTSTTQNKNLNHRANVRLEYTIDKNNSIVFTPRISWQGNDALSTLSSRTFLNSQTINTNATSRNSSNNGFNFSGDLLFRHRFAKNGRTFSVNLGSTVSDQTGITAQYSISRYFTPRDTTQLVNQQTNSQTNSNRMSIGVTYTEPVGKMGQLQFDHNVNYTLSNSDREVNAYDEKLFTYSVLKTSLSSVFDNTYLTNRTGMSYRLRSKNGFFTLGAAYQNAQLASQQTYPIAQDVKYAFNSILPNAMFNYRFTNNANFRIFYRTNTNAPSVTQLQGVINNSNPTQLSTGNPDLKQDYSHNLSFRYGITNAKTAQNIMMFLNLTYANNSIVQSTFIADKDYILAPGITLFKGSQLTKPINLDGALNARTFMSYGIPVSKIKSNLNLSAGVSYAKNPNMINNVKSFTNTYGINGGAVLSSNLSEKVDFTLSYTPTYSIVRNSVQTSLNTKYVFQNTSFKINWLFGKGFLLQSEVLNQAYSGLGSGFNQNFTLWNAGFGYKFLKKQAAEIRLNVFDILKQNNSIARNVSTAYIEDARNQVLTRYFMLTFTYNLKNFRL
ncbi:TonB-dependent receptor [Emticicia oligotrophica DSM 17448]|uniref:TonB-dependent receptor n=1 Tax=Emticicia oligotrophica (strain DSM 17448 / CIP 109782 / MTCC 6937 / GPTSA100-15) TaxID=929562 RepID=A0ABN4AQP5_EMTOG|nr:TonB-dependent receptor [Emticicia oligotrophica]AFK04723.1 TonB-dependent receptor [Emticicia oligotrophica DSM 17448]